MPNINQHNQAEPVEEINAAFQETLIHIELNKTLYAIVPSELTILEEGASSIWKDITLASLGIALPCAINAVVEYSKLKDKVFNQEIFINSLIGALGIILAIICGVVWLKSKNKCKELIAEIKKRPKYKM